MKRMICLLLAALLLLAGCAAAPAATTETTEPSTLLDEEILNLRRQKVLDFMRSQLDFYWRCDETIEYVNAKTGKLELVYEAGQVYRGLPYGQSGGTTASFLRYSTGTDDKGIHQLSGLKRDPETGKFLARRLGSDCAATVWTSWSQVASSISADKRTTKYMTTDNGFLRVGEYDSASDIHQDTKQVCRDNGEQTMFEAYALLQPADACVHFNGSGHAIMITEVTVKRNQKTGEILGNTSFVKYMDQTSGEMNDDRVEYVEELGCEVHIIGNVEKACSFSQLFAAGYLPVTCKELRDPAPEETETLAIELAQERSGSDLTAALQDLTAVSNRAVNVVTVTVSNSDGVVQACSMVVPITVLRSFSLANFLTEPNDVQIGFLDPTALAAGSYELTVEAVSVTGLTVTSQVTFTQ